ncbi:MAG: FtsX-like permease family protein [Myxococcales bacterium]
MTLLEFAARNALRNRFRTLLTVTGVAITILTFVLLRTVIHAWNAGAEYAAKDRIATRNKVSYVVALPRHYVDAIREVEGVEAATWMNWFGGKDAKNPDAFFANFVVDHGTFLDVYDEIVVPAEQRASWYADRQGVLVGASLAKQLNLKPGDRFTLQGTIYPGDWTLNVSGIYRSSRKSFDQSSMIFRWDYMNEAMTDRRKDQIGWVVSKVAEAGAGAEVSATIDRMFDERDTQTLSMSERALNLSFLGMFDAILKAIDAVSAIILLILIMILANTMAMGVRERTNEYGALRALGFLPKHIRFFILGEAVTIGLSAGALGLCLAYPLINLGISRFIEENMGGMFPFFRLDPSVAIASFVIAMLLGLVAGLVPALQAGKLSVVEALRRVE